MKTHTVANPELQRTILDEAEGSPVYSTPAASGGDRSDLEVTLFVACYNEEENIIATLEAVVAAMAEVGRSWEMIVIDDASTDTSVQLIKSYMCAHPICPIILITRGRNRGLARNFDEAAFIGNGTYYRLICGDNVESSAQIAAILGHIGKADMVIPYHAEIRGRTLFRRWLSRAFTFAVNLLSGYRLNYFNGCSVHFRHDVMRLHADCSGFDFQANLITRLLDQGRTYVEIPVVCAERVSGRSKALTLKNALSAARFLMDLAFRRLRGMIRGREAGDLKRIKEG